MNREAQCTLYIVKEVTLESELKREYIEFLNALNKYIQCKYPEYYNSVQLYEDKEMHNKFYTIASYYNVEGIYEVIDDIEKDVTCMYSAVFEGKVKRNNILSFDGLERLIPPICR